MTIKINVETPTIDFEIAGVKIVADVSDRSMLKALEIEDSEEFKNANKEIEKLKGITDEELTIDKFNELLEKAVNTYDKVHESIFGKGAFKEVFEASQSIVGTIAAFEKAMDHVNDYYQKEQLKKSEKYRKRKKK